MIERTPTKLVVKFTAKGVRREDGRTAAQVEEDQRREKRDA